MATDPAPSLVPAHVSPHARPGPLLGAAAAIAVAFGAGLGGGVLVTARAPLPADPCALPAHVELGALAPADRGWIARRAVACSDRVHGRITAAAYQATIARLDAPPPVPAVPPAMVWASTLRAWSTQYTDASWSAARVLGPPDVFPASGDNANAWASLGADDRPEWIEVGLPQWRPLSAVQIFETLNPGAITHVELVTASGERRIVYQGTAGATGTPAANRTFGFACTEEPIAAIRVSLDSPAVAGWNELDAIGALPCD